MTKEASLKGFQTVTFKIDGGDVTIMQAGDGGSSDLIIIPLEHFWAFVELARDVGTSVKQMGYR